MSFFGLWSTDAKPGADALVSSETSLESESAVSTKEPINQGDFKSPGDLTYLSAFAPSTPDLEPRLLEEGGAPVSLGGDWANPHLRKQPLQTPFAALANESTSFKSLESETGEVAGVGAAAGEAATGSQDGPPSEEESGSAEEPSTAAVVMDILSQLFLAKSAEPEKEKKEEKKKEEQDDNAPVALYFPFSADGPPPPPPIPSDYAEFSTDEEEQGSVDMVTGAAEVLEKVRDVLRKESEKQELGDEIVLLKSVPDKPHHQRGSSDSTPEHPATPENVPRPSSERLVPLIRVASSTGVPAYAASASTEDSSSEASSPFLASVEVDGYGPVIAAAVAGGGDALASKQGHQILPIVPSSGPGELAGGASLTLQQQQSSDLYTWLFGNTPPPVDKTASPRASDAPPEDSQTQNLGLASSQTAAGLSPAAGLDAAAQALPGLPVAAMERQASQLVQQETTAERLGSWTRSENGSMELKSCLRSPCGSECGDEPCGFNLKRVNSNFKMVRFAEGVVDPENPLYDRFKWDHIDARLVWTVEPPVVRAYGALYIESSAGTDCWQRTLNLPSKDNAHFLHIPRVYGDFVMTTHVRFMHVNEGDQAGLMVRLNSDCWLKAAVTNHPPGSYQLGAVATNGGHSDWSMAEFPPECNELDLRIRREGTSYTVEAKRAGKPWTTLRQLALVDDKPGGPVMAGLYAAAPNGAGASAEFKFLRIEPCRFSRCPTVDSIPEDSVPR